MRFFFGLRTTCGNCYDFCTAPICAGMLARNSESEIMQTAVALLGCDVDDALKFLDISITSAINCRMNSSDCSKTTCKKQRT